MFKGIKLTASVMLFGVGLLWGPAASAQLACLNIQRVDVTGVSLFTENTRQDWVQDLEGKCLGLAEFDTILQRVTTSYIDAGYILSRAYLPEQDLNDGTLTIAVVEGTLSAIRMNGEDQPRWSGVVFPGQVGKPVNLRDVEQGLDTLQGMPRWQAEMAFDSGEDVGESILDITAKTDKPFELKFTSNNQGNDSTGKFISGFSGDVTNFLGLNDTFTFGFTNSLSPNPVSFGYEGDTSRSRNLSLKIPYGGYEFTFGRTWSDYSQTIPGPIDPISVNGGSKGYSFEWKSLLFRDQDTKSYLTANLNVSTSENYIAGVFIDISSRRLSNMRLTYSKEQPFRGGDLSYSAYVEKGLRLFQSEDNRSQPEGAPDAQHFLWGASASLEKDITFSDWTIGWDSTIKAQYSNDRLYSGQFSIGGVSTVRGSRIALATGSSGILWRNDFSLPLSDQRHKFWGTPEVYTAIDFGRVLPQSDISLGGSALGHALGFRLKDGAFEFDISYQRIVKTSDALQQPDGEFFANLSYTF